MRLVEHEGKELLRAVGIKTSAYEVVRPGQLNVSLSYPIFLKSQVPASDRKRKGGIVEVIDAASFAAATERLFSTSIDGHLPTELLAEEKVQAKNELYVSFSYTSDARGPVLALAKEGGTGVAAAVVTPIPILEGLQREQAIDALVRAGIRATDALVQELIVLWGLFIGQKLVLLEVNPLFLLADGSLIAGDAKVITDAALAKNPERPFIALGGDIAIIASGGGASMLNIDLLMRAGGKPANYVEYSGNPPAEVVEELTVRALSQPKLRGAWVVGGTANFTDNYETMKGFVAGLRRITPKPTYPIIIRRDGPRQAEAKELLERVAREELYALSVFGPELSMAQSADVLLKEMKHHGNSH